MHEAEQYLRNPVNSTRLYVRIAGKRRTLFINREANQIGIIAPKKKIEVIFLIHGTALKKYIIP